MSSGLLRMHQSRVPATTGLCVFPCGSRFASRGSLVPSSLLRAWDCVSAWALLEPPGSGSRLRPVRGARWWLLAESRGARSGCGPSCWAYSLDTGFHASARAASRGGVTRPGLAGFVRAAWIGLGSLGDSPLPPSGARPSQRLTGTCPSRPDGCQSEFVSG